MKKDVTPEITDEFIEKHKIDDVSISVSPEEVDKKLLKKAKKCNIKVIEIIAKSSNNYILKKEKNNYTFEQIKKAAKKIRWNGFKLGIQMMVGMPDSTKIDDYNTAKDFAKLKPKMVRIYPFVVEKNMKIAKEYESGEFEPITVMQAVERCKEGVYAFHEKNIDEIAIGMKKIKSASSIVAGPNVSNFTDLVEDSIWYDSIVNKIKMVNAKVKEVRVTVNPANKANVIGYKKSNIKNLKDIYNVDVIVQEDEEIKEGKSQIDILSIYED